jgi:16S rRNA C967 or C1407 C5-methylase (RsmB/RsmF family)
MSLEESAPSKRTQEAPADLPVKLTRDEWVTQRSNPLFEEYYRRQLGLPEDELQVMLGVMKDKLPVTFRVNVTQTHFDRLIERLEDPEFVLKLTGNRELSVSCVEWHPSRLVWSLNSTRGDLKKRPGVKALHQFIHQATDSGLITRQELVSMLPPLALDVHPGHLVLDMCAAPGSKTAQMLELINGQGLVCANDVDSQRAFMLIHQLQRSNTANIVIVNHPGQQFPSLRHSSSFSFDRVLCDVPCTGDGAIRKLPVKWFKWNAKDGQSLHPLQLSILDRALTLVDQGGLVCYSTCSLNPIEDEAVVCEALRRFEGSVELVDLIEVFAHKCPGLRLRPGLTHWKVLSNSRDKAQPDLFIEHSSFADVPEGFKSIRATMFPVNVPPQIQHSVRVLPHDQDTGGFYIALFRRVAPLKPARLDSESSPAVKGTKKLARGQTEFHPVPAECEEYLAICSYWGIEADSGLHRQLYCPSAASRKNLYLVSHEVTELLAADSHQALKVLNMGVKLFAKNTQKTTQACQYRLTQNGLPFISHLLTKRKVAVDDTDVLFRFIAHKHIDLREEGSWKTQLSDNGFYVLVFPSLAEEIVAMKVSDEKLVNMLPDEHADCLLIKHKTTA